MEQTTGGVPFRQALRFWLKLGFINFGGPAGQVAIMHRELVERLKWTTEEQFLRALNFCMILPGPEAQQLATYVGWRLHGILGGIIAGSFFILPGLVIMMILSWLVVSHSNITAVAGILYGIQAVVIAIVAEAVIRIGKRTLHHPALLLYAALAFGSIYFLSVPFPAVIALAALSAVLLQRPWPHVFKPRGHGATEAAAAPAKYPPISRALRIAVVFALLWIIPVGALWFWRGTQDVLMQEALFFTGAAFITFGGAYAVLSYIAGVTVTHYGWLDARQMVQGLGLAESTPGPLILVTQFVGFLGAWKLHGTMDPLLYGILGAVITVYVTFLPSFFFIFVGAPYVEALAGNRRLQAALVGVTSAVVGVILNLGIYFGSRVLWPQNGILDVFALSTAVISFVLLWLFRVPIHFLVPLGAAAGAVVYLVR